MNRTDGLDSVVTKKVCKEIN